MNRAATPGRQTNFAIVRSRVEAVKVYTIAPVDRPPKETYIVVRIGKVGE